MPPDSRRGRPGEKAASCENSDTAASPAASLQAWGAAVANLHSAGLPAAVPPFPAAWLARRGIRADWVSAA